MLLFSSPGSTVHPLMRQPQRDRGWLCLKNLGALVFLFVETPGYTWKREKEGRETQRRKQLKAVLSHLKSLWVDWFVIWVLLLHLLHARLWSGCPLGAADTWRADDHDVNTDGAVPPRFPGGLQLTRSLQWPLGTETAPITVKLPAQLMCFQTSSPLGPPWWSSG